MTPEMEVYLAKEQVAVDTPETPLDGDDFIQVTPDSKVEAVPAFEDTETVQGKYGLDPSTRGLVNATANLGCFIRSRGDADATYVPDFHRLAIAGGLQFTEILCVGSKSKFKYSPATTYANHKALTIWHHSGGVGIGQSIIRKIGNIQGGWKITGKTGAKGKFDLVDGKGVYIEEVAGTKPAVTPSSIIYPAILPLTVSIDGVVYNVLDFSFEGGNTVDQYIKCSDQYGYGASEITKKKGKFDVTVYSDVSKQFPMAKVLDGTLEAAIALTYGPTGKKIEIAAAYPQYKDCKFEQSGNLSVWKVTGELTENDFSITVNSDLVAA